MVRMCMRVETSTGRELRIAMMVDYKIGESGKRKEGRNDESQRRAQKN